MLHKARVHDENRPPKPIYVACPGGLEGTWGMSLITRYIFEEWIESKRSPELRIVDTTGTNLGWHSAEVWRRLLKFVLAVATIGAAAISQRMSLLYLQTAEGGSVLRKLFLAGLVMPFGIPVVLHMHAAAFPAFFDRTPRLLQRLIAYMFNQCDCVIVLGERSARYFETTVKVERSRIKVIPNGVPDPASSPVQAGSKCKLLFLGTLTERKGLDDLFEALGRSELRAREWSLTVAGSGDAEPWLAKLRSRRLAERVSLPGWAGPDAVCRLFEECDVLVLPSHDEGLPLVILEAMAHSRPVIATSVGSVRDAVANDITGLVVEPRNVAALAASLCRLIDSPQLRVQMGASARSRYESHYRVEQMSAKLAAVFIAASKPQRLPAHLSFGARE